MLWHALSRLAFSVVDGVPHRIFCCGNCKVDFEISCGQLTIRVRLALPTTHTITKAASVLSAAKWRIRYFCAYRPQTSTCKVASLQFISKDSKIQIYRDLSDVLFAFQSEDEKDAVANRRHRIVTLIQEGLHHDVANMFPLFN